MDLEMHKALDMPLPSSNGYWPLSLPCVLMAPYMGDSAQSSRTQGSLGEGTREGEGSR